MLTNLSEHTRSFSIMAGHSIQYFFEEFSVVVVVLLIVRLHLLQFAFMVVYLYASYASVMSLVLPSGDGGCWNFFIVPYACCARIKPKQAHTIYDIFFLSF